MIITWAGFRGENRALPPVNLPDMVGTKSNNQNPVRGDLRAWKSPLAVATVANAQQTIYRMGRDVASDTNYWLSWPTVVHAVRGFVESDTSERTYYTGDGFPKWTDNTIALASAPYPTAWRQLGVPAPATPVLLTASGGVSTLMELRYYVYTYVTDRGEEGAPSPVSASIYCKTDAQVSITNLTNPPAGNYGINRIRTYRTQSGASGSANFFFLREIGSTQTSTTDDERALGEVLPSTTWLTPPADLSCLTGLWNGMMAGITGQTVRFCEAYKPYAWPLAYEVVTVNCSPVALAKFGQRLLILTTGRPVLVTGGSPGSMDEQPLEIAQACVSQRSVVSFGHGVVWACPDGLMYYGSGGMKMITNGIMTRDDWQAINPSSIVASIYEGAYIGFYTVSGVTKGFLIDPLAPTGLFFTDIPASAVFFDEFQDHLYVLDGINIKRWDAGTALTTTARSKTFRTPKPCNFACAEMVADTYPVTFSLWADGVLRHTTSVTGNNAFRLPSGFLGEYWQIEVSSATGGGVQGVALATSVAELAST